MVLSRSEWQVVPPVLPIYFQPNMWFPAWSPSELQAKPVVEKDDGSELPGSHKREEISQAGS